MKPLIILDDIKKKLTGYDRSEQNIDFADYRGDSGFRGRGTLSSYTTTKYPDELFMFFETLCSILPDKVNLDEFMFNMELLINDLQKARCGFHNNSDTKKRFTELMSKIKTFDNFPVILTYFPRFIEDVADSQFSTEFSRRFGEEVLGEFGVEAQKQDYGYIEVSENLIDISNKDKAEVLAGLYNNSHPQGMGIAQYDPAPMTTEIAKKILEQRQYFDYLKGRPLKINLEESIIRVGAYNYDNGKGLAQRVISNCRNINDIGKDKLKKVQAKVEEELQKQIEQEVVKKHQEMLDEKRQEEVATTPSSSNNGLDYLRVNPSTLPPVRKLVEESGYDISDDTLQFVRSVENQAYPEEMKVMQDIEDIEELEDIYNYYLSELTIARNRDWYIIYGEDEDSIEIVDIASLPTRDSVASQEIHNYITRVINQKAHNANKPVTLNAKEDTSYRMILRMVSNGEYEILEDERNTWEDNDEIIMHNLVLKPIIQRNLDDRDEIS